MWTFRTALLVALLAFVFAKPFRPWRGNRHLVINKEFQKSDSMESSKSSNTSDSNDTSSSSESDMSVSSESSGSATSDSSESSESASSEEEVFTTAEPETGSAITDAPPLITDGGVTCFTVHPVTEPRGDNFKVV